jgi:hypothetical protein
MRRVKFDLFGISSTTTAKRRANLKYFKIWRRVCSWNSSYSKSHSLDATGFAVVSIRLHANLLFRAEFQGAWFLS